jgi:hypothetical protein
MSYYRRSLDWWFTNNLQVAATSNYNVIVNSHTLKFPTGHTKSSQFFASRFLATDPNNVLCVRLATNSQAGDHLTPTSYSSDWLQLNYLQLPTCPTYNISTRTAHKTPFLIVVVQLLPWEHVCLQSRYSLTALVYLFISRSFPSNGSSCYNML